MTTARVRILFCLTFAVLAIAAAYPASLAWGNALAAYRLRTAKRLLAEGKADEAIAPLEGLDKAYPDWPELKYLLGVANRRAGRLTAAFGYFEKAERLGWSKKDLRRQRLMGGLLAGNRDGAEKELQRLIERDVSDEIAEEIYEAFAKAYLTDFRLTDAKICLEHWLRWRPNAVQPRLWLIEMADVTKQDDGATRAKRYREVIAIAPDCYDAHMGLAQSLQDQNGVQESLEEYQWCMRSQPTDPRGSYGVAICLRRLGKSAEAMKILKELLETELTELQRGFVLSEIGQIDLELGQLDESLSFLEQAVKYIPTNTSLRYALGSALSKLGKRDESKAEIALADKLAAQSERITEIERELAGDPRNAELRCEAGEILYKQGDKKSASLWLLSAVRFDPKHRRANELLAEFYHELGREDLAAVYRSALADSATLDSEATLASEGDAGQEAQ